MGFVDSLTHTTVGRSIELTKHICKLERRRRDVFQFWSLHVPLFFIFSGRNAAGKGVNYAYQGVQPANGLDEDNYVRHAYYQWVPFVLFLQGNDWAFFSKGVATKLVSTYLFK